VGLIIALGFALALAWGVGCSLLVVHLLFHPLPGLSHFLCLAKESHQRKARPRWRPPPWILVAGREGSQTRCAQTRLPSLSSPQQKIQGAI
jgi:hypothetical protein